MTALPAEVTYGRVVGRVLIAQGDGPDLDTLPDAIAAAGTVTFMPVATVLTTSASPATILRAPIQCTIAEGSDGWMRGPQDVPGVWLTVGLYDVEFNFDRGTLSAYRIEVTAEHTAEAPLDLTLAAPLIPGPATVFVVNQQVYEDTLAARADVLALVDGLGNPVLTVNGEPAGPGGAVTIPTGPTSWASIVALPDTPNLVVDTDTRLVNQRTPADGSVTAAKMGTGLVAMTSAERTKLTGVPADAQSATQVDTRADSRIAAWVGAAPAALDTLDELAAALADNANFVATVTASLATKTPATRTVAGKPLTGDITLTPSDVAALPAALLTGMLPVIYATSATTWPTKAGGLTVLGIPTYTGPVIWDGAEFMTEATWVQPAGVADRDRRRFRAV